MSQVSVIGLGAMGSAIANAFMSAGHEVTVWNRSPARTALYRNSAATIASDPAAAVAKSPLTVICIDDYSASNALLESPGMRAALNESVIVQLSTGTPGEARNAAEKITAAGARYLDGAILAYPREVGHDALIAISGNAEVYESHQSTLGALSTDIRYLGAAVGAAAALDVAVLSYYAVSHIGLVHAALVCEAEQVAPDVMTGVLVDSLPSDVEELAALGAALASGDFSDPGASIGTYDGVLERILSQARDAGINDEIPRFASQLYRRGIDAGLGDEEVVALIKLLRR